MKASKSSRTARAVGARRPLSAQRSSNATFAPMRTARPPPGDGRWSRRAPRRRACRARRAPPHRARLEREPEGGGRIEFEGHPAQRVAPSAPSPSAATPAPWAPARRRGPRRQALVDVREHRVDDGVAVVRGVEAAEGVVEGDPARRRRQRRQADVVEQPVAPLRAAPRSRAAASRRSPRGAAARRPGAASAATTRAPTWARGGNRGGHGRGQAARASAARGRRARPPRGGQDRGRVAGGGSVGKPIGGGGEAGRAIGGRGRAGLDRDRGDAHLTGRGGARDPRARASALRSRVRKCEEVRSRVTTCEVRPRARTCPPPRLLRGPLRGGTEGVPKGGVVVGRLNAIGLTAARSRAGLDAHGSTEARRTDDLGAERQVWRRRGLRRRRLRRAAFVVVVVEHRVEGGERRRGRASRCGAPLRGRTRGRSPPRGWGRRHGGEAAGEALEARRERSW